MNLRGTGLVTESRREKISAFIRREDKARCLVAGLLLRQVCGVENDSQLAFGENGKPYLENGGNFFNISHSGEYVVLATSPREVGVDIEKITAFDENVAARVFTRAELAWLDSRGTDEAFFQLWTAKESLLKAVGAGLSIPPESFTVLPLDAPKILGGRKWLLEFFLHEKHIICRAIEFERQ